MRFWHGLSTNFQDCINPILCPWYQTCVIIYLGKIWDGLHLPLLVESTAFLVRLLTLLRSSSRIFLSAPCQKRTHPIFNFILWTDLTWQPWNLGDSCLIKILLYKRPYQSRPQDTMLKKAKQSAARTIWSKNSLVLCSAAMRLAHLTWLNLSDR